MKVSEHFTLDELTASDAADRRGLDNSPPPDVVANLCRLAQTLEKVRAAIGKPVIVNSAYRSPAVNDAIGGSDRSQHMRGLAADIKVHGMTAYQVCMAIMMAGIEYDQLIREYGWTHISVPEVGCGPRNQELTKASPSAPYKQGILP